jgi:hypothetical protein
MTHTHTHTHRNSTPLLCQLRLAALGHIRELVFVTTTPLDWHQLVSVVTADPPHLRSLVVRASYGLLATARPVLQCLATANKGLQFLCLRSLKDLEKIPDVISTPLTHPSNILCTKLV